MKDYDSKLLIRVVAHDVHLSIADEDQMARPCGHETDWLVVRGWQYVESEMAFGFRFFVFSVFSCTFFS